jgi:hypothetical protein
MRASDLALLVLAVSVSPRGYAARGEVYALVGAVCCPVRAPIEKGTVVIRDGLIEAVGASSRPWGARHRRQGTDRHPGPDGFGGPDPGPAAGRERRGAFAGRESSRAAGPSRPRASDALKARQRDHHRPRHLPRGRPARPERPSQPRGDKLEGMVLRQPAAMHLHMATLSRTYPGRSWAVAYAPGAVRRRRYRDECRGYEAAARGQSARSRRGPAGWQDVLAGKELLSSPRRARTTSAAPWPWPTSSR